MLFERFFAYNFFYVIGKIVRTFMLFKLGKTIHIFSQHKHLLNIKVAKLKT